jgi:hypothetical protein
MALAEPRSTCLAESERSGKKYSKQIEEWRRALIGQTGNGDVASRQREVIELGLDELAEAGPNRSARVWWAFEGSTSVDCYIKTEKFNLYVEGKRTESLSKTIDWFPTRNQFVRNLESAREHSGCEPFACILMSESPITVTPDRIAAGLPHLTLLERDELLKHYLGNITWKEACDVTGVCFEDLPDTL